MKKFLCYFLFSAVVTLLHLACFAQLDLAPNQNPNYAVSRSKYMKMADSLNEWHSTTQQQNYKAIDWLADRREARADRREFRQQLRLERARNMGYPYYYSNYHGNYQRRYYHNYRENRFHVSPWYGLNFWW